MDIAADAVEIGRIMREYCKQLYPKMKSTNYKHETS